MVWYTDVDGSGGGGFGKKISPNIWLQKICCYSTPSPRTAVLWFSLFSYLPTSVLVLVRQLRWNIVQPVCLAHSSENTYEPIFCGNIICRVSLFGGLKRRPSKFGGSRVLTALATRIKNTFWKLSLNGSGSGLVG